MTAHAGFLALLLLRIRSAFSKSWQLLRNIKLTPPPNRDVRKTWATAAVEQKALDQKESESRSSTPETNEKQSASSSSLNSVQNVNCPDASGSKTHVLIKDKQHPQGRRLVPILDSNPYLCFTF